MTAWRVIFTDSESLTGVAPACPSSHDGGSGPHWVHFCCPGPHLELYDEGRAAEVAALLTATDAKEI